MKCAAIYVRVSTGDQSTAMQVHECLELVRRRGWLDRVGRKEQFGGELIFSDVGISGSHDKRPGLTSLRKAAHRGEFDVLVVWRSDRLFRSVHHMATMIPELAAQGISFVSVTEAFDTTTPTGALMLHVLAAFAQFERDVIVERTIAGMAEARRRGAQIGRRRRYVDVEKARHLLKLGQTVRDVALELGIGYGTLQRALGKKEGDKNG
jgi:DNA invertase Pin-like site-specific DNA recombinase